MKTKMFSTSSVISETAVITKLVFVTFLLINTSLILHSVALHPMFGMTVDEALKLYKKKWPLSNIKQNAWLVIVLVRQ